LTCCGGRLWHERQSRERVQLFETPPRDGATYELRGACLNAASETQNLVVILLSLVVFGTHNGSTQPLSYAKKAARSSYLACKSSVKVGRALVLLRFERGGGVRSVDYLAECLKWGSLCGLKHDHVSEWICRIGYVARLASGSGFTGRFHGDVRYHAHGSTDVGLGRFVRLYQRHQSRRGYRVYFGERRAFNSSTHRRSAIRAMSVESVYVNVLGKHHVFLRPLSCLAPFLVPASSPNGFSPHRNINMFSFIGHRSSVIPPSTIYCRSSGCKRSSFVHG